MTDKSTSLAASSTQPQLVLFTGHSADVTSLAFSPDGHLLASASYDRSVIFWDTDSGAMIGRVVDDHEGLDWVGFSPDGVAIATSNWQGVRVYNAKDGNLISTSKRLSAAYAFTPSGHILASPSWSDGLLLWDPRCERVVRRLKDATEGPFSAALSADGTAVAVTDLASIRIVDLSTGHIVHTLTMTEEQLKSEGVSSPDTEGLAFSPDGNTIAAVGFHGVRFWNTRSGEYLGLQQNGNNYAEAAAFSPDGKAVASGWDDGSILLRVGSETKRITGHDGWVRCLAFSPDGSLLASGGGDGTVRLWKPKTGKAAAQSSRQHHAVFAIAFAPDGNQLVSGYADGTVAVWNAKSATLNYTARGLGACAKALAISPDGMTVAVGGGRYRREPGELKFLRLGDLDAAEAFPAGRGWFGSLSFSPDGTLLACEGDGDIVNLWNVSTHELVQTLPGCAPVAFSPDGRTFAAAGDPCPHFPPQAMNLWDLETGELRHKLVAHHPPQRDQKGYPEGVTTVTFSKDGKMVAIGHSCFVATLWDAATGEMLHELAWRTYSDHVSALAFSPNGRTLAVGIAYEDDVHLWSTRTGKERVALRGHTNNITSLAYSPDGTLASASADGTIKLWHPPSDRLLATLLRLPAIDGTDSGWLAYTPDGHYCGSEGAEQFIRWKIGSQSLSGDAYSSQFRRTDLSEFVQGR